jgi:hypothetical protein
MREPLYTTVCCAPKKCTRGQVHNPFTAPHCRWQQWTRLATQGNSELTRDERGRDEGKLHDAQPTATRCSTSDETHWRYNAVQSLSVTTLSWNMAYTARGMVAHSAGSGSPSTSFSMTNVDGSPM